MRKAQRWFLVSLALFAGAWMFWQWGEQKRAAGVTAPAQALKPAKLVPESSPATNAAPKSAPVSESKPAATLDKRYPYRLANTQAGIGQLMRNDRAILLRNALIDTGIGTELPIPAHLRIEGDAGAYIVQARGAINDAFRQNLRKAGAVPVSYIPNNAFLVQANAAAAKQLAAAGDVQAVLPYEPYYKLDQELLKLAVEQQPLPDDAVLNLVLFPDKRDEALPVLEKIGAKILREERTPFGPSVLVQAPADSLGPLARWPAVQIIEKAHRRQTANDLARVRLGVADSPTNTVNYMGLTGAGVLVNINDSGVDASHPDLAGRVVGDAFADLQDDNGHGTHVAGSILGNGSMSGTVRFAKGSVTNANFRGMAPGARAFVMTANPTFGPVSDVYLQETAAKTNALISNNSWFYLQASDYTMAAASYDAAVRDALPGVPGEQPVTFVFCAGNGGGGGDDGLSGASGTVLAPGTAKNVITVGAIEQPREITNIVEYTDIFGQWHTNQIWLGMTDNEQQVAGMSGRGNVAPGIEGEFGRFKPDLVAPGTFVVSCRSSGWQDDTNRSASSVSIFRDLTIPAHTTNHYSIYVPPTSQRLTIRVLPNANSPASMFLLIVAQRGAPPGSTTNETLFTSVNTLSIPVSPPADTWYYDVANPGNSAVSFDLLVSTSVALDPGTIPIEMAKLNDDLGPYYRYESGTSMSAAFVSGLLALMQEYFGQRGMTNSPALMKALLINGARAIGYQYDFQTKTPINHQGWGLPTLTNCLPLNFSGVIDQSTNRVLATGDRHTFLVTLDEAAKTQPLRITLVWTDPPGNPIASLKLVNDLDLIVTNLSTGEVYFGNNFEAGAQFSVPTPTNLLASSNALLNFSGNDMVNNVENVFIREPGEGPFSVTVFGRRVNVNAVTANWGSTGQDYALVVSSGNGTNGGTVTLSSPPDQTPDPGPLLTVITNGQALIRQRVGANAPLLWGTNAPLTTNGVTNQWNFYVFTNAPNGTNGGTNVAFVTFMPPNLSRPRLVAADIDMYVSTDGRITNLDAAVLAAADRSVGRGGTEAVYYTNASIGTVYYIAIRSQDQQGGEFGLFASSSNEPLTQQDENGNLVVRAMGGRVPIPDGTPDNPQAAFSFAICTEQATIRRVIVTNEVTHENRGDLVGILSHEGGGGGGAGGASASGAVVLNSHDEGQDANETDPPSGYKRWIYEDNGEDDITGSQHTDGPGSLRDYVGEEASGVWMLTMIDNAPYHVGEITGFSLLIERALEITNQFGWNYAWRTVQGGGWSYDVVNVPRGVTNFVIEVMTSDPLQLYVRRDAFPSFGAFDYQLGINPPGGQMAINIFSTPPLSPGRYIIGVYNPGFAAVTFRLGVRFDWNLAADPFMRFASRQQVAIPDDAVTNSYLFVPIDRQIADLAVDVRLDHPRVSDLVLHLVSPTGQRLLLFENRGGPYATNLGSGYPAVTWIGPTVFGGRMPNTNVLNMATNAGTLYIDGNFGDSTAGTGPNNMRVYYEGQLLFDSGPLEGSVAFYVNFGPGTNVTSTNLTLLVNELGGPANAAWYYTPTLLDGPYNYLTFVESTNSDVQAIKFTLPPFDPAVNLGTNGLPLTNRLLVLPEEPFKPLIAQSAYGWWRLEIWDNLAGNPSPTAQLLGWQLHIAFVNTNIAGQLIVNGTAITNTLAPGQTAYFTVNTPLSVHFATNILNVLTGDTVTVVFNQFNLPTTNTPNNFVLGSNVASGVWVLDDSTTTPVFAPGAPYYIAVQNTGAETNTFVFSVFFDLPVVLPNGAANPQVALPGSMTYFQVNFPPEALSATFELVNLSDDVDLYVARSPTYPTLASYFAASTHIGTSNELISVTSPAGQWFVGVYNTTSNNVTYDLVVSYSTTTSLLLGGKTLQFGAVPRMTIGRGLELKLDVVSGLRYRVQASSDLQRWETITNVLGHNQSIMVRDPSTAAPYRFYRFFPIP